MTTAHSQDPAPYLSAPVRDEDDAIIARALDILAARLYREPVSLSSPAQVMGYLTVRLAQLEHEVFGALFLDSQNRLLYAEDMFRGTLNQTSVHPREMVKAALACNAGAAILYHNHPSGEGDPSQADEQITKALKQALALVGVKVLDHFIVAGTGRPVSFAERGLL